jgi:hypothetical protein
MNFLMEIEFNLGSIGVVLPYKRGLTRNEVYVVSRGRVMFGPYREELIYKRLMMIVA